MKLTRNETTRCNDVDVYQPDVVVELELGGEQGRGVEAL